MLSVYFYKVKKSIPDLVSKPNLNIDTFNAEPDKEESKYDLYNNIHTFMQKQTDYIKSIN
jgi:hypothetical protein